MEDKSMKKLATFNKVTFALVLFFTFFAFGTASAQKMGYVDTEYILQNIPEYQDAQNEIEEYSKQWQAEIEEKYSEVEQMYKDYQVDAVLLPEDLRQKREQEIIDFEREIKELQKKRFGSDGELFKKRQELVKPIQEKIFNAIEEIATKKNYAFIFDKAGGPVIMYVDSKYDISDEVLDQIGSIMGVRGN